MTKAVIVEPEAEADIARAYAWYEAQREGLGDDFALCVEAAIHTIGQRPRLFRKVRKNARRVLLHRFPYQILYVERREVIAVVGVFHSRRDPSAWETRLG